MTLVVLGCVLLLSFSAGGFLTSLGERARDRTRAQLAADASALAAVASSAPQHAGADPREQAAVYAERNGGRLLDCVCRPGATSMEVEVGVGDERARARAVIDTRLLQPLHPGSTVGLHPRLQDALDRLLREAGGKVRVGSGFRSRDQQERLWTRALARYGSAAAARRWVAPPGSSMHERGLAVDLSGDVELAASLIERLDLPLHRPLHHEPWHFELRGSRG